MDAAHAANTRRIAKNTIFLYGRMLLGMLISLYTSRVMDYFQLAYTRLSTCSVVYLAAVISYRLI